MAQSSLHDFRRLVNFGTNMILELSVPFETNLSKAREHKVNKYANLVTDIQNTGYKCDLVCF